jgi:hypothetical protein
MSARTFLQLYSLLYILYTYPCHTLRGPQDQVIVIPPESSQISSTIQKSKKPIVAARPLFTHQLLVDQYIYQHHGF